MINQEQLAICKQRGHDPRPRAKWMQCKWCGTWAREITVNEEREDEPPIAEQDYQLQIVVGLKRARGQ